MGKEEAILHIMVRLLLDIMNGKISHQKKNKLFIFIHQ
jgi:hypothetical protein